MQQMGAAVLATTALLALAGCSSSGSTAPPASSSTPTASAAAAGGVCNRLTDAINKATGGSWTEPQQTDNGPIHQCHWTAAGDAALAIQVADGESHVGFMDQRALVVHAGGAVRPVNGLGTEAYSQSSKGTSLVAVRSSSVGLTIQLQGGSTAAAIGIARAVLTVT